MNRNHLLPILPLLVAACSSDQTSAHVQFADPRRATRADMPEIVVRFQTGHQVQEVPIRLTSETDGEASLSEPSPGPYFVTLCDSSSCSKSIPIKVVQDCYNHLVLQTASLPSTDGAVFVDSFWNTAAVWYRFSFVENKDPVFGL